MFCLVYIVVFLFVLRFGVINDNNNEPSTVYEAYIPREQFPRSIPSRAVLRFEAANGIQLTSSYVTVDVNCIPFAASKQLQPDVSIILLI